VRADYDLVIASQPYRARVPVEFKASKVIGRSRARSGPAGACSASIPAAATRAWRSCASLARGETLSPPAGHDLLRAVRTELGKEARHFNFNSYSDARAVFRYDMHTLPTEVAESIGTSTLFAGLERRDLRGADRRRAPRARRSASASTSTPRARCCSSTAVSGSWMNPMSSLENAVEHSAAPMSAQAAAVAPSSSPAARSKSARTGRRTRAKSPRCCPRVRRSTSTTCRGHRLLDTIPTLIAVRNAGLEPGAAYRRAPHPGPPGAEDLSRRATGEAGVRKALILGGDEPKAVARMPTARRCCATTC
jgi:hypothetical protein